MIGAEAVYLLAGAMFALAALTAARDRRARSALFWALVAAEFLVGSRIGDRANGLILLALAGLAAAGLGRPASPSAAEMEARAERGRRHGLRVFLPALVVPAATVAGALLLPHLAIGARPLAAPGAAALLALGLAAAGALALACLLLRPPPSVAMTGGAHLLEQVGWAAILPQALAALGAVFAAAGVARGVATLLAPVLPHAGALGAAALYSGGMAALTVVTGNAFAAFPVMAAGVGLPVLVARFGADPAAVGALGMLSGFCGTLVSPLAANFNLVPVRLLELRDRHAVIRVQAPTAAALLLVNTALLYLTALRR